MKVSPDSPGIFAAGHALAAPRFCADPGLEEEERWRVEIEIEWITFPDESAILLPLLQTISSTFRWCSQASGIHIPDEVAEGLETVWSSFSASRPDILADLETLKVTGRSLDSTERETLAKSRIGQGKFREDLIRLWNGACAVSGVTTESMLRASHLKPWRISNNAERLDPDNGLLLIPNLDQAFDMGLISFADDGAILISPRLSSEDQERLGLSGSLRLSQPPTEACQAYLVDHRNLFGFEDI